MRLMFFRKQNQQCRFKYIFIVVLLFCAEGWAEEYWSDGNGVMVFDAGRLTYYDEIDVARVRAVRAGWFDYLGAIEKKLESPAARLVSMAVVSLLLKPLPKSCSGVVLLAGLCSLGYDYYKDGVYLYDQYPRGSDESEGVGFSVPVYGYLDEVDGLKVSYFTMRAQHGFAIHSPQAGIREGGGSVGGGSVGNENIAKLYEALSKKPSALKVYAMPFLEGGEAKKKELMIDLFVQGVSTPYHHKVVYGASGGREDDGNLFLVSFFGSDVLSRVVKWVDSIVSTDIDLSETRDWKVRDSISLPSRVYEKFSKGVSPSGDSGCYSVDLGGGSKFYFAEDDNSVEVSVKKKCFSISLTGDVGDVENQEEALSNGYSFFKGASDAQSEFFWSEFGRIGVTRVTDLLISAYLSSWWYSKLRISTVRPGEGGDVHQGVSQLSPVLRVGPETGVTEFSQRDHSKFIYRWMAFFPFFQSAHVSPSSPSAEAGALTEESTQSKPVSWKAKFSVHGSVTEGMKFETKTLNELIITSLINSEACNNEEFWKQYHKLCVEVYDWVQPKESFEGEDAKIYVNVLAALHDIDMSRKDGEKGRGLAASLGVLMYKYMFKDYPIQTGFVFAGEDISFPDSIKKEAEFIMSMEKSLPGNIVPLMALKIFPFQIRGLEDDLEKLRECVVNEEMKDQYEKNERLLKKAKSIDDGSVGKGELFFGWKSYEKSVILMVEEITKSLKKRHDEVVIKKFYYNRIDFFLWDIVVSRFKSCFYAKPKGKSAELLWEKAGLFNEGWFYNDNDSDSKHISYFNRILSVHLPDVEQKFIERTFNWIRSNGGKTYQDYYEHVSMPSEVSETSVEDDSSGRSDSGSTKNKKSISKLVSSVKEKTKDMIGSSKSKESKESNAPLELEKKILNLLQAVITYQDCYKKGYFTLIDSVLNPNLIR